MPARPSRVLSPLSLCALLAVTGLAAAAAAQPAGSSAPPAEPQEPAAQPSIPPGPGEPPPPEPEAMEFQRPTVVQLRLRGELGFNASLRDEPGDVTVTRLGGSLGVAIPIRRAAQLDVGFDYEYSHYAFSDATTFVAGVESPWENIHRETLSLRFSQQQTSRLGWFIGGSIGFAHEEGASLSDSLVGSGFGGIRYALSERAFLSLGTVVVSQLEDGVLVYPLLGIDWRITDQFRLTNAGRLGITAAYDASEQLTFSVGASYDRREFRLRDSGPVPDGVGRDQRVPIAASVTYRPTPQISIEVAGGAYLLQSYRLSDADNNRLADIDARPTPFVWIQGGYRF
jgi:hypothetical protein